MSKRRLTPLVTTSLFIALSVITIGHAGVVLDGTLGWSGSLKGPNYMINADLGKQVGGNLFHSFSSFNITRTESAVFRGPGAVENIISRVTGGSSSTIDGLLKSEIQGANLYFINPAGIMFGPNATLDVSGSFHATTADYLKLGDSGIVYADTINTSVLTSAPPSAFGFLSDSPRGISVEDSFLQVPEGKTLSMIGGDQAIQNGTLHAPSGTINLVSVVSRGEAITGSNKFLTDSFSGMGKISIMDTRQVSERPAYDFTTIKRVGNVDVSGEKSGGKIFIRGGDLILVSGQAKADTFGSDNAQGVDIKLTGNLDSSNGSFIASRAFAGGSGGSISITAPLLTLDGSYITSESYDGSTGSAGNISINVNRLSAANMSQIVADSYGDGRGGDQTIHASTSVSLSGGSYVESDAQSNGDGGTVSITAPLLVLNGSYIEAISYYKGNAGNIFLNVGNLTAANMSQISTSTYGFGNGGTLEIDASKSVSLSGFLTSASSSTYSGIGGSITVKTPLLELDDRASLFTSTSGVGKAGNVFVSTDIMSLKNNSYISTAAFGSGMGGALSLMASSISLDASAYISSDSVFASGNGGPLDIKASSLMLDHDSFITSSASGKGNSGGMLLNLDTLQLRNGSMIRSTTTRDGSGGDLHLYASKSVFLSDELSGLLASSGYYTGNGGNIYLKTPALILDNGADIASTTSGSGNAGSINLDVGHLNLNNYASIRVSTRGRGSGGFLNVNAADYVSVAGNSYMSSSASLSGNGGFMLIRTPALSILDWGYLSSATSGTGNAGTIELTLGSLDLQNGGRIYSDSLGVGRAGSVTVNAEQAISVLGSNSSISSNAHSTGDGGSVLITTPYLTLNSGELSCYTLGNGLGGSIRIDAREMRLTNEASISSESKGTGNAGNISVTAAMLRSDNASITTEALKAAGGNIHLEARDLILTDKSAVTASVAAGEGGGGNVSIKANVLVALDDSDITAKADQGYGGNITIDALSVFTTKDVNFDASSNVTGREGKVEVRSPVTDISSSIVDLPAAFLNIDAFLPKQCTEREEEASSFVVRGRDGLPPQPESLFAGQ